VGCGGSGSDGDARDLLQVIDKEEVVPVCEKSRQRGLLALADFEREKAVGLEQALGLGDEAAVDVEAVGACKESGNWLVLADLGMEAGAVRGGNVRGIAGDSVEGGPGGQGGEEVGTEEANPVGYVVIFGVELGDVESFGGEVESRDVGFGEMDGQGDGDGSRSGAYVGDGDGMVVGDASEYAFDEVLGLGPGDENGGADAERKSVELLLAGDVLDGLVTKAAVDCLFVEIKLGGGKFVVGVGEKVCASDLKRVEEEELGVALGFATEVLVGGQLLGCGDKRLAKSNHSFRVGKPFGRGYERTAALRLAAFAQDDTPVR
jgi:hypothetical protein